MYKVANGMSSEIMNGIFKLRENTHYNLRRTSQFLVDPIQCVMVVNLHCTWDPKFGNKHTSKLKILTPLLVLNKKLENGNLRTAHVEFAKFTHPI